MLAVVVRWLLDVAGYGYVVPVCPAIPHGCNPTVDVRCAVLLPTAAVVVPSSSVVVRCDVVGVDYGRWARSAFTIWCC